MSIQQPIVSPGVGQPVVGTVGATARRTPHLPGLTSAGVKGRRVDVVVEEDTDGCCSVALAGKHTSAYSEHHGHSDSLVEGVGTAAGIVVVDVGRLDVLHLGPGDRVPVDQTVTDYGRPMLENKQKVQQVLIGVDGTVVPRGKHNLPHGHDSRSLVAETVTGKHVALGGAVAGTGGRRRGRVGGSAPESVLSVPVDAVAAGAGQFHVVGRRIVVVFLTYDRRVVTGRTRNAPG